MKEFRFKQFSIKQTQSAMKVGTDSVLLGAWTPCLQPKKILDIGAGTGILSLMMAQRTNAKIEAIEIDKDTFEECSYNFEQSLWKDRLTCYHSDIKHFKNENTKYDLIISNPPFFTENTFSNQEKRNLARFTQSLSFESLLGCVNNLLCENGIFSVVIPFQKEIIFTQIAQKNNLFPQKITRVKGSINSEIKRSLLIFSKKQTQNIPLDEISIEISRHNYTDEYQELTKDFYLNF